MKKLRNLIAGASLLCSAVLPAQNLILNPGFESGSSIPTVGDQVGLATNWYTGCAMENCISCGVPIPGSPDLFDARSNSCGYGVPANKWGTRSERTGGNRYVGFTGTSNYYGLSYFGESVMGTLSTPLSSNCSYVVSFYATAIDGFYMNCDPSMGPNPKTPYGNFIEVVLRKSNDNCSAGKIIYSSGPITQNSWTQFSAAFSISAADVAVGYNRVEFRLNNNWTNDGSAKSHAVYLDDVSITYNNSMINAFKVNNATLLQCGEGGLDPEYYNCGSLLLNTTYSNGTPSAYMVELFTIDGDCEQLVGAGYMNYSSGWVAGAVPANLDLRTLYDGAGQGISNSPIHNFYLKVSTKDGCGNITTKTGKMYIYSSVSATASLEIYNTYYTSPANTYLGVQHNIASAIPTGALSVGFRISGSTGVVTGYKVTIYEVDNTGVPVKTIHDKTFSTSNITTVAPLSLNSLCVASGVWSPTVPGGGGCTSPSPSYSGYTGYFGFSNGLLTVGKKYQITITLLNPCSNVSAWSYIYVNNGYARPAATVGIDETETSGNSISVYPNPATNAVKFKINSERSDVYTISIYDITGKLVKSVANGQKLMQGEQIIDVNTADLEQGVYTYKVQSSLINKAGLLQIAK